jgi:hypothetical protein
MSLRRLRVVVAFTALVLAAGPALALSFQTLGTVPGLSGAHTIRYTLDQPAPLADVSHDVYVVGFASTLDSVMGTSFCVDVLHSLNVPGSYTAVVEAISAPYLEAAQIAQRWANDLDGLAAAAGATLADAAAGVQLALWRSVYDEPAGLGVISFSRALTAGEQRAYDVATNPLHWRGVGDTVLTRLTDAAGAVRQAQVFTPAVPEPTGFLVFGVGSLVVASRLRRSPVTR